MAGRSAPDRHGVGRITRPTVVPLEPPRTSATSFLAFTFTWSLLFWVATVLIGGVTQPPGSLLFYVGGAGPLIAALVLVHAGETRPLQRDFWARTFDPRRISWRWLMVACVLHPAIVTAAGVVEVVLGGEIALTTGELGGVRAAASLIFFVFVFGPLPEEMGWRGVALERLQRRLDSLNASLVLGAAWALWHVPLFLIDGTFQHQLGFGGYRFWVFMADLIPLTIIITWVYNHTDRSILAAVLVHFTGNLGGALMEKSDRLAGLELVGLMLVAAVLVAAEGRGLGER